MKKFKKWYCIASVVFATVVLVLTLSMCTTQTAYATSAGSSTKTTSEKKSVPDAAEDVNNGFSIAYNNDGGSLSAPIKILLFLTVITLAPSILIMLTSFTRIIVVLHFLRSAIGTQTSPPNQVLIGLALFLTLFIMSPVFTQINEKAIKPLDAGEITQEEALEIGMDPLREFMFGQTAGKRY